MISVPRSTALFATIMMLGVLAGCASAPGGSASPSSLPSNPPAPASRPYLATLTVDAESATVYAEPSTTSPVVATLSSGEQLLLLQRLSDWLQVRTPSGAFGFLQPSALVAPTCTVDRAEPRVLEVPLFARWESGSHGTVVIEAEFDASAQLVDAHVVSSSLPDHSFEETALSDLKRIRFLPPTKDCKPRPFFYTFTREF